jgi:hypothetical protein
MLISGLGLLSKVSYILPFVSVKMINIVGVISVIIFYILILAVGMWAARKNSGVEGDQEVHA